MCSHLRYAVAALLCFAVTLAPSRASAQGLERLCDPGWEDCRQILIDYIRAERVGLDVAFWFMEDSWIAAEVISRHKAGVPVRVLMDTEANGPNPLNAQRLAELKAAGVPMRERVASGILHWKMMLFAGQGIVEFSGANFSSDAWVYAARGTNYVDEAIYFTDDPKVVNSFRTKYDELWTNTAQYANYANINGSLFRRYDNFPKDPELNFAPAESFFNRSKPHYDAETQRIDVIIYRITDQRHTNAMIAAKQRGVPVRIITEPQQYRDPKRLWHSWNIDRLHMAGIPIRDRAHAGLNHQKLTLLHGQRMSVMGSSNWTSPSDDSQEEHNYFTRKAHLFTWLAEHFERKWDNRSGVIETTPFEPQPPDAAANPTPAAGAVSVSPTGVTLKWDAGYWAHNYDIYLGTSPNPPLYATNQMLGPSQWQGDYRLYAVPVALNPGTTYYWKIVSKTMAHRAAASQVWSFTTSGSTSRDTISPAATITSPSSGATVNGTVSIAVNATDNVGVGRVEMLLDGVSVATDTAAPYTFAWDTRGAANGTHTLQAYVADTSGNSAWSSLITVTVSNTVASAAEVMLWAADVKTRAGGWTLAQDTTAAGGIRIWHPDAGAAKITTALAAPTHYFEMTFNAEAGKPYRIWMRGKASYNGAAHDSVFIQFDKSVNANGSAMWRIGTTSAAEYNLEECSGCGLSEWGWQDNGWGVGVMGPVVYFNTTGPVRMRIQTREDGLCLDQIVLSPAKYLNAAPGPNKNDRTILGKTQ